MMIEGPVVEHLSKLVADLVKSRAHKEVEGEEEVGDEAAEKEVTRLHKVRRENCC